MALTALLTLLGSAAVADDATELRSELAGNQREQAERQEQLDEVAEQAGTARERLEVAQERLDEAQAELAERREELAAARAELDAAQERAREARAELRRVSRQLERTEQELAETQLQLDHRVRAAFKYGQVSLAEALAGVADITDFINSTTYVGHVMASDKELVEAVAELVEAARAQRAQAQTARATSEGEAARAARAAAEVEQAEAAQRALTDEVAERRAEQAEALEDLERDAAAIAEHLDELQRCEERVRSQIAEAEAKAQQRLEEERRRQQAGNGGASGGSGATSGSPAPAPNAAGWLRPTNGRMSSPYGYRTHPVHGGQRLHAGVDLASPTGTSVRSTRDGVVSFAGWMNGYGNTVMVSHGGGQVSLYAHLSSYGVAQGAYVSQGTVLGGVGMTGTATGPHLHFEVRAGGQPQNPCGFIAC